MKRSIMNQREDEGYIRFDKAGTYTWKVPSSVYSVDVFLVGGGGGGGASMHSGGGGGGGGEVICQTVDVTPFEDIQIVVGEGGSSGYVYATYKAYNGNAGENTSFKDIIARGGDGGQSAYGSYSAYRGAGGINYSKGGDGEQVVRFGHLDATPGAEGVTYDGNVYGSGGGAGGRNGDGYYNPPTNGGTNAGQGSTSGGGDYSNDSLTIAVDGFGCGGGAVNGSTQFRNGGCGCVIIKYKRGKN